MRKQHHLKRSDLFLVRVWAEETADGSHTISYRGRVQRVVDGETRPFEDWQALLDALLAMLSTDAQAAKRHAE